MMKPHCHRSLTIPDGNPTQVKMIISHLVRKQDCGRSCFDWSWRRGRRTRRLLDGDCRRRRLRQRRRHVGGRLLLLLDRLLVADGAETFGAGVAVEAAAVAALNRMLLHLVGIAVHRFCWRGRNWFPGNRKICKIKTRRCQNWFKTWQV